MRRLRAVLAFEVGLHLRRPTTWGGFAVLAVLGVLPVLGMGADMGRHVNAPAAIMLYTFILGMVGVLVTAALCADAGVRDALTRMQALFHTTPLRREEYLGGRYLGVVVVNAIVLLGAPVGLALAMLWPEFDRAMVGPFQRASYERAAPRYRALHRVGSGMHSVTVDVAGQPKRAGIDPDWLLIARRGDDLSDNVRDVALAPH